MTLTIPMLRRLGWRWLPVLAALIGYAGMWLGYRQGWGWLQAMDFAALDTAYRFGVAHPGWVRGWDVFCTVFGPAAFRLAGLVVAVLAMAHHRLRAALLVLVAVEFSGLVSQAAKDLTNRPRPATALVSASSSAFPSGHAVGVMVGVAALLTVTLPVLSRPGRVGAIAVGALLVLAVGTARVLLNVHHPSDVLAGWSLGYLYFAVCRQLVNPSPGGRDGDRRQHRDPTVAKPLLDVQVSRPRA